MLIIYVQGVLGLKSLVRVDYHGSAPRTSAACSSSWILNCSSSPNTSTAIFLLTNFVLFSLEENDSNQWIEVFERVWVKKQLHQSVLQSTFVILYFGLFYQYLSEFDVFYLLFSPGGRCVLTLQSGHSQLTVVIAALSNFGFTRINPATIYFKGIKLEFAVLHLKTCSRLIHLQFT